MPVFVTLGRYTESAQVAGIVPGGELDLLGTALVLATGFGRIWVAAVGHGLAEPSSRWCCGGAAAPNTQIFSRRSAAA